ncbi:MAG: helix-turn-helix transcriptional regulator [Ruminococcaceae bacterium]|nr:helix-turn-helix transcriptional regulator [Oscillospiraceae bacterium]
MKEYARRLRDLRTDRELSQIQVAVILGTTKNQVGKYERGEQEMPIRHLITLCNYYGVSADYVLGLPEGRPYGFSKTK